MLVNEDMHYGIEKVYSDPSAAHERAMYFKKKGAYRCLIEPENKRYVVTAWFYTREEAVKACYY